MYLLDVISHFYLSPVPAHFHTATSRTVSHMQDSHMYNPRCVWHREQAGGGGERSKEHFVPSASSWNRTCENPVSVFFLF